MRCFVAEAGTTSNLFTAGFDPTAPGFSSSSPYFLPWLIFLADLGVVSLAPILLTSVSPHPHPGDLSFISLFSIVLLGCFLFLDIKRQTVAAETFIDYTIWDSSALGAQNVWGSN